MMSRNNGHMNLWVYLDQSGILQSGDPKRIEQAKKEYWRKYDTELKRKKRAERRSFTLSLPKQEMNLLRKRAADLGYDAVDYIKLLIHADLQKTSLAAQSEVFLKILQLLQQYRNAIQRIEEGKEKQKWFSGGDKMDAVNKTLRDLEAEIRALT